uniref:hypothetical protein n=1 Tax=Paractinoplanes polyasparticus TaxID=2856853 RepID=UPI001C85198D|nr:hypothetical protein [Actinoplanes polyasparticus]
MSVAQRRKALSEDKLIRRFLELKKELGLDSRDFVIFGSGPLLAHGLRDEVRDLDVVARGETWDRVRVHQEGKPRPGNINGASVVEFCGGHIQFSRGWISDEYDADELIDHAEHFEGLPFARLDDVLRYKKTLRRSKDRLDIAALSRELDRCDRARGHEVTARS